MSSPNQFYENLSSGLQQGWVKSDFLVFIVLERSPNL